MKLAVLMPAHNERALERTLAALRDASGDPADVTVVLVDDGSDPGIDLDVLPNATTGFRVVLAKHVINLGQGAAIETARQLALRMDETFDAYVTMDADGQHAASDALDLARAIRDGADVAFGNRFLGDSNVPAVRRAILFFARWFERAVTGLRLADAHNGLRAFSRRALEQIPIHQNRMAHATEIKLRVAGARTLTIVEVPVSVRYSRETLAKGQQTFGAAIILADLVLEYLFGEKTS